jgi:hypothetical protein
MTVLLTFTIVFFTHTNENFEKYTQKSELIRYSQSLMFYKCPIYCMLIVVFNRLNVNNVHIYIYVSKLINSNIFKYNCLPTAYMLVLKNENPYRYTTSSFRNTYMLQCPIFQLLKPLLNLTIDNSVNL